VIERIGYDSERDLRTRQARVLCQWGGFLVSWDEVKNYMHVESCFNAEDDLWEEASDIPAAVHQESVDRPGGD
jgi:hypothetical protein